MAEREMRDLIRPVEPKRVRIEDIQCIVARQYCPTKYIASKSFEELAQRAVQRLKRQGYPNVEVRVGNGYSGWPEHAPFDKVIVSAAPDLIPPPLINQLKAGGRMVIPIGLADAQQLAVANKDLRGRVTIKEVMPVRFSLLEDSDEPVFRAS